MDKEDVNKKIDELICKNTDHVFESLLPNAPYLENTMGSFVKHGKEKYYSPGSELFELLALNIAVAFVVNLFSAYVYDKFFSKQKSLVTKEHLNEIISILKTEIIAKIEEVKQHAYVPRKMDYEKLFNDLSETLQKNGWPREKAEADAHEVLKKMNLNKENEFPSE